MFPSLPAASQGRRLTANLDQLRALYVQRLVKYVNWPDGVGPKPGEPFIVAATDPASLRPYFGSPAGSVRFKLVQWPASDFHVLVLTGAPDREISAILKRVADLPILTISQNPVHLRQGVMVNFYMNNGKLKFEINPAAAKRGGLSISSRLLQLARIYQGEADD
ncbi:MULTISPECIES: YfiR family protein [unclassified Pseudodesulfovibrio]|uniref:YfiR family protein n=1 Tax=unclassified Pseudodesulfovibrio TaxID=2661612 RepID=UPI001F500E18|nr:MULTISPECIES: YfiR family protein [unclassified Pseudodesulfovibrio]MCJ2164549.1 YfiR family protein [Pseudodesulfovibrio sp. S3-i]